MGTGLHWGSRWGSLAGIGAGGRWISVGMGGLYGETTVDGFEREKDMRERRGLACRTLLGVGTEW